MRLCSISFVVCVLFIFGCDKEEAPFDYARSVCERRAECGMPSVMCQGVPPNQTCVGTLVAVDYDQCYEDETSYFDSLSATQQAEQSTCARWCAAQECVSQEMVDALAASYEGQDASGFPSLDPPPECGAVQEPWFPPCGVIVP